jgi:EAL domain-containing protein (putative c-di-GMP-specific phosphodiesterase class I)
VLANADIACHIAKRSGRNRTHLYEKEQDSSDAMGTELGWSTRLRDSLQNNGFELSYQPIMLVDDIDMDALPAQNGTLWQQCVGNTSGPFHYEVLVRMRGENGRRYFPESFIPTAERFNMMTDVDMWVLEHALQAMVATSSPAGKISLSLNLSGHTLDNDAALKNIKAIITNYNIAADSLIFEITETSAIANLVKANIFIDELHALGCKFSLDDFGSGFCSFSQLKNLATDYVKIDGQFVKSMARGSTDRAIVTAMNDVAHSLGRCTVAEYVESPEVVRLLKVCGVDRVQGHYISSPLKGLPHGNVISLSTPRRVDHDSAG